MHAVDFTNCPGDGGELSSGKNKIDRCYGDDVINRYKVTKNNVLHTNTCGLSPRQ